MSSNDFRENLLPQNSPRVLNARGVDPFDYAKPILERPDARFLVDTWLALYGEAFQGITANGTIEPHLFALADEGFDTASVVQAAESFLSLLSGQDRKKLSYPIHAREWRSWYNPEFPMNAHGLRLDYAPQPVRDAAMQIMRASLGKEGYRKTEQCRLANRYLGQLYQLENIMNEWSYHFLFFGTPSLTEPWGWSIFGHHLAINCFLLGRQMVVSPMFMGVEPNAVEGGPEDSFEAFRREQDFGLELLHSISPEMRDRAIIYRRMVDPGMPEGRWHFADERQLGSAFQDNRVIPYEGIRGIEFSTEQREMLMKIVATFLELLPEGPREARLSQIRVHLDDTYFSWIGGFGADDPFYYRVQSPVILLEFDHHSGVWLTNAEPARFHIHTSIRTPNGNDYGKDLLRQYYDRNYGPNSLPPEQDRDPEEYGAARARLAQRRTHAGPATRDEHNH